jgi:hypothetical protein
VPKRFGLIPFLAIGIFFLAVLPALAETVDTAWVRRYNGPGDSTDFATAIAVDSSGDVYVTGYSWNGTDYDYATIKYYSNGDTAWVRRYNGPVNGQEVAYALALDGSGDVYVTGYSYGIQHDFATIKYYSNGDTAWVRRYNGPENKYDEARAIAVDSSGNVYVTGCSNAGYATIKYYPNGDTAWVRKYYGTGGDDQASAIAIDCSGNVYVTGKSMDMAYYCHYATIKYYPNGDTAWVREYYGPGIGDDSATAIAVNNSGNVYVTGYSHGNCATIKYDASGDTAWVRIYSGGSATAIAVDGSANIYVTGYSATIRYYSSGDTAWVRIYSGGSATAIAVDDSGNVFVTGRSYSGWPVDYDYTTIKYHPNGDTAWVRKYKGPGNGDDMASAIAIDGSGNVYVTGKSYGSGTDFDYATIKYVKTPTDVKDETGDREKPSEFALFQNYPNPFNQTTKIEFTLAKSGFVTLNIYDLLGRKVRALVSKYLSYGHKSVLWDGKNDSGKGMASGIYFYQLRIGDFSDTKKLVLLK